jgi:hypothetical protein
MGWFSRTSSSDSGTGSSRSARSRSARSPKSTDSEPVRTRAELAAIAQAQQSGSFNDPSRGRTRSDGGTETVIV